MEVLVADGSFLEDSEEPGVCLLEPLCAFCLDGVREVPGRFEHHFCLSGALFAVFSLRGFTDRVLLLDGLFFDVAEFQDAFGVSRCVHEVEVCAITEGLEDARGRDVREPARCAELLFVEVDACGFAVGRRADVSPVRRAEDAVQRPFVRLTGVVNEAVDESRT